LLVSKVFSAVPPDLATIVKGIVTEDDQHNKALQSMIKLDLVPVELDSALDKIPDLDANARTAASAMHHILYMVRTHMEVLHSTHNVEHLARHIRDLLKITTKPKESSDVVLLHEWAQHVSNFATNRDVDGNRTDEITVEHIRNFVNFIINKIPSIDPNPLERIILNYTVDLLANVDPSLTKEDVILGMPVENEKMKERLTALIEAVSEARKEWTQEVFNEATHIKTPEEIVELIIKANEYDAKPSDSVLMNLAYHYNKNGQRGKVLTLLAHLITSGLNVKGKAKDTIIQSPSLLEYFLEVHSEVHNPEPINDRGVIIKRDKAEEQVQEAVVLAKRGNENEQHFWSLEKDEKSKIRALAATPPSEEKFESIRALVQIAIESNKKEDGYRPQRNHNPKYWMNKYYECMTTTDHECRAYLCAAGSTDSPIQEIAIAHCFEYANGLAKAKKSPKYIPDHGNAKRFLARAVEIELLKIADEDGFMTEFVTQAVRAIKRNVARELSDKRRREAAEAEEKIRTAKGK
jgi:hypothetical protein